MRCTVLLLLAISVYAFFLMFQEGAASDVVIPDQSNFTFSTPPRPTLNPTLRPTLNPKLRPPNRILQDKDEKNSAIYSRELKMGVIVLSDVKIYPVIMMTSNQEHLIWKSASANA